MTQQFRTTKAESWYQVPFGPDPFPHICQEGFAPCGSLPAACQCGAGCRGPRLSLWWESGCFLLVWPNDDISPWHAGCFLSHPCTVCFLNYVSSLKACSAWLPGRQLCMEGVMLCPLELMTDWFTPVWLLGSSLLSRDHWLRKLSFLCVCFTFNLYLFKTTGVVKCKPCRDPAKVSNLCHLLFWIKWIQIVSLLGHCYCWFWKAGFLKAMLVLHKQNFLDTSVSKQLHEYLWQHTNHWSFPKADWNPQFFIITVVYWQIRLVLLQWFQMLPEYWSSKWGGGGWFIGKMRWRIFNNKTSKKPRLSPLFYAQWCNFWSNLEISQLYLGG